MSSSAAADEMPGSGTRYIYARLWHAVHLFPTQQPERGDVSCPRSSQAHVRIDQAPGPVAPTHAE